MPASSWWNWATSRSASRFVVTSSNPFVSGVPRGAASVNAGAAKGAANWIPVPVAVMRVSSRAAQYRAISLNFIHSTSSRRVANPGCYATAVTLALAPLLASGLAEPRDVVVTAASGTSGAGRKATDALLATQVMGSMSAYKVGGVHQHTPEMEQSLSAVAGAPVTLSFTPLLAPMPRGIVATCTAVAANGASAEDVREALVAAYRDEPFVHVLAPGQWPQTSSVAGSNAAQLQVALDAHAGRIIVVSAIDNLGKGAAGQAVQNANLVLGLDERAGLTADGVAP